MLAARLVRRLNKKEWSLSVAESCTGGLLASAFTDIAGASDWFTQGWVTYANESKVSQLGVNPEKLEKKGAVSHTIALDMAKGAQRISGSGVTISITGIAGPTGLFSKPPVGTVYVAVCIGESYLVRKGEFGGGDRASNKHSFVIFAMQKAIEAWDVHFTRRAAVKEAVTSSEDEAVTVGLTEALASMDPNLDTWQDGAEWGLDEVATTLDKQSKDALATDVDWSEE
jgi:nicotinamide-nucleotide amidase